MPVAVVIQKGRPKIQAGAFPTAPEAIDWNKSKVVVSDGLGNKKRFKTWLFNLFKKKV